MNKLFYTLLFASVANNCILLIRNHTLSIHIEHIEKVRLINNAQPAKDNSGHGSFSVIGIAAIAQTERNN